MPLILGSFVLKNCLTFVLHFMLLHTRKETKRERVAKESKTFTRSTITDVFSVKSNQKIQIQIITEMKNEINQINYL